MQLGQNESVEEWQHRNFETHKEEKSHAIVQLELLLNRVKALSENNEPPMSESDFIPEVTNDESNDNSNDAPLPPPPPEAQVPQSSRSLATEKGQFFCLRPGVTTCKISLEVSDTAPRPNAAHLTYL